MFSIQDVEARLNKAKDQVASIICIDFLILCFFLLYLFRENIPEILSTLAFNYRFNHIF